MSKAILVIDMPDKCINCPCFCSSDFGTFCGVTDKEIKYDYDKYVYPKPNWCPLKALPEMDEEEYKTEWCQGVQNGWNNCINEILGTR